MTATPYSSPPWIGDATQATLCNFGTTGAAYAAAAAWGSAYTGQIWGVVGFAATSAALAAASAASGCYIPPPPPPVIPTKICCELWSDTSADVYWYSDEGQQQGSADLPTNVKRLVSVTPRQDLGQPGGKPAGYIYYDVVTDKYDDGNYTSTRSTGPGTWADSGCFSLFSGSGSCQSIAPEPEPILPDPPEPVPIPDPETGCNWSVSMEDSYLNAAGNIVIQYVATADDPATCGGPIYWWEEAGKEPVIVQPDPTDPTKPIPPPEPLPVPCPDPCPPAPDPCPPIPPPHELGATTYQLTGICETVPEGQAQPRYEYPIAAARFEEVLSSKLDAIASMLQQHLELKTPTCSNNNKPVLRGDWRSVHFESDAPSPSGTRPLRKYFRYRSESGSSVAQLGDHWKDFTWEAGSVIVVHKGGWWGTPKVWAASIDEGKRVIRHAAAEAGIDPDQVGEWIVTGSSDSRYGMPGTMRPVLYDGLTWATARTGPDGPPTLEADS